EQDNIYHAIMTSPNGRSWEVGLGSGPVSATAMRTFLCPADPSSTGLPLPNGWAGCNYAANALIFGNVAEVVTDKQAKPQTWNVLRSGFKIGMIPDGSANTILFAERFSLAGSGATATLCAWADPPAGGDALGSKDVDAMGCPLKPFVSNKGPLRASICG